MSAAPASDRHPTRPAAVLWDMDGTIVDTEPYWIATEYALVAEFGGEWDDEKAHSLVGNDLRVSASIIRDRGGVDLPIDDIVNRLLDGVIAQVQRKVPWRPGARELLAAVRKAGVPNAMVTMSWTRFAVAVADALPPGTFDVIITGDEVTNGKPHPEPYLAAAAKLGVRAQDCVAIEDSPTGVRSAVAAGCRTFAVPNVVDIPPSREYTRVDSLHQVDLASLGIRGGTQRKARRPWGKLAATVVALVAVAAGAVVVLRRDEQLPPLANIPVSAWAPYWTLPEGTASVSAHGSLLHQVSPFWYTATGPTAIGLSGNTDPAQTVPMVSAITATGGKVVPSISDGMKAGGMAAVLADPALRAAHVKAVMAIATKNRYDGIDLDYEQFAFADPRSTWAATRPNWVAFVTELATALHAQGKVLTVSVPPIYDTGRTADSGYWVYDYAAMGAVTDGIRIMAYDYSVGEPGPIAPYDWVQVAVKAAKRAVDDDTRLVLGIGLYGRNWVVGTTGTCPSTAERTTPVTQRGVDELIAKRNATPVHDEVTREAHFTYDLQVTDGTHTCTQSREVHYIDEQGASDRIDLARAERIGGVAFWALGFDSEAVWTAVTAVATPQSSVP